MATDPSNYERYPDRDPNRPDYDDTRGSGWGVAIAAVIIMGLIALMVSRLWTREEAKDVAVRDSTTPSLRDQTGNTRSPNLDRPYLDQATPAAEVQQPTLTLLLLTQDPAKHYGQSVTIQGVVRKVINPSSFTIASSASDGSEVLIVSSSSTAMTPALAEGKKVRITGTFKAYDQGQIETALGDQFSDSQFNDHREKPMIIATSVQPVGDVAP